MVGALAERRHRGQRAVDMTSATIAVVGAGPVGLTAALALADAGQDIALIAPTKPPADRRTSALLVGSVALLDRLGVWSELKDAATPLRRMRIVDGTHRLIRAPEVAFDASEIDLPANLAGFVYPWIDG